MHLAVTLHLVFLQVYYSNYYSGVYCSSLRLDFDSVVSVSQISVSATLLVLAEGNCEIRVE